ncbi:response regulator [Leptolyngbya sp. AN03gr2]|uniref:response regulator n=1 Tax=unclassified Leptolyngbya TaxID=2650499 RepID=UPI003D30FFAC
MITPPFVGSSGAAIAHYHISGLHDLAQHFQTCRNRQISGRLDLSILDDPEPTWSFFFRLGQIVWSIGELHPLRRWHRQLAHYCPQLAANSLPQTLVGSEQWNGESLINLVKDGQIQPSHLSAIVAGGSLELLFDVMQARPTINIRLTYRQLSPSSIESSCLTGLDAERAWQRAAQLWSLWQQWGLENVSPNLAPVIWDHDGLREQTSLLTYHNLSTFANGNWTLRDLAVKLKQPLVPLTRSLMPYVNQGIMAMNATPDLQVDQKSAQSFLVAYIEDSRFDSAAMSQILNQAGYRFLSIPDPRQAVPMLLDQKPDLIFLDLLMPIANGYEICTQIRRITAFQSIPIVILTSSDGIVDRVRAKLAGASGFLSKPIDSNKVLETLRQHLRDAAWAKNTS